MVSKTAQADVEDMWDAGLKPSYQDIIRLNALALRVERVRAGFSLSVLPRVSFLGDVVFHEPTIGSEIWMADASRLFDDDDTETFLILRAFSLSMPQDKLPTPTDKAEVLEQIQKFKESLGFATIPQIMSAVGYAVHGFDPDYGEVAAKRKDEDGDDDTTLNPLDDCYDIGLLRNGMVYRLGSASDLKSQPRKVLEEMLAIAFQKEFKTDTRKDIVSNAEDDYLRTLDEITTRLRGQNG